MFAAALTIPLTPMVPRLNVNSSALAFVARNVAGIAPNEPLFEFDLDLHDALALTTIVLLLCCYIRLLRARLLDDAVAAHARALAASSSADLAAAATALAARRRLSAGPAGLLDSSADDLLDDALRTARRQRRAADRRLRRQRSQSGSLSSSGSISDDDVDEDARGHARHGDQIQQLYGRRRGRPALAGSYSKGASGLTQEDIDANLTAFAAADLFVAACDDVDKRGGRHCVISFGQEACAVCLEGYETVPGARVRQLPCGHIFHQGCIDAWLLRCNSCPLCLERAC